MRLLSWRGLALLLAWGLSVWAAVWVVQFVQAHRNGILRRLGRLETSGLYATNLYTVRFERVRIREDGRYGAITPLGRGVLFSSRSGRLWFADSARALRELASRVPINIDEFAGDPYNDGTVDQDLFAVKDLFSEAFGGGVRLFASHNQWDAERDCYFLRVSVTELPLEQLLGGGTAEWRTLYDTRPCLEVDSIGDGKRRPTIGAGGRIERINEREVLLTVGIFLGDAATTAGPEGASGEVSPYGKTVAIDVATGATRIFTVGHRNSQGLAVGDDGRVWLTEHSARGGDELNLLRAGADYGYPHANYGTTYETLDWPTSGTPGRHEGPYAKPMQAFVPSIGPSQLIVIRGTLFPRWGGDLLLSSLPARSLFRVRIEEDRVIFVEPIHTGHRIRDLIETADGEIVFLAEDGFLVYLDPADAAGSDPDLTPRERGALIASRCLGCHTFEEDGANRIGPNLHGILGRDVASVAGFTYSAALRAREGRWTADDLARFIADPKTFAPGTTMEVAFPLTPTQHADLMAYFQTLR